MTPQELKNSILKKAFTGKISVQHKYEYVDESKIDYKKNKNIKDFEFDLPGNWTLSTIEGISKTLSTKKYQIKQTEVLSDGDFPVISQSNEFITGYYNDLNKVYKNKESVVIFGDHTTVVKYIDFDFVVGADGVKIFEPFSIINAKYLYYCLSFITIGLDKLGRYSRHYKFIKDEAIPVPPLGEQKRIVEKIEELMPLVDEYEKNWQKLEDLNKKFPEDMKKSLIQEAIRGKLVEQRPGEGDTSNIIKKLLNKKQKLVEEGRIYKKKPTTPFFEGNYPFDIPETWRWVQLSDVSVIQEGAGIRKYQYKDEGTQLLCVTNILENNIDLDKKQIFVSEEDYTKKYQHLTPMKGDIVTACSGGSWGKVAIYELDDIVMLNTSTLRMRFFGDLSNNKYLYYVTQSDFFKEQLKRQLVGIQPNFGYAHYSRIEFPLPPLAEQKRIVEKLDELLPLCDQLIKSDN